MKIDRGNIFVVDGNFWTKITGATLTIENNTYILEFQSDKCYRENQKIIQGEFLDLGFVTLVNCQLSGISTGIVNVTKFNAEHIITQIKFKTPEDLLATSLHVRMDTILSWLRKSNLTGNMFFEGKMEYSKAEKITIYENDEYVINIHSFLNEHIESSINKITLTEYFELEICSKIGSIAIFELFNIYKKIKMFFAFVGVFSAKADNFYLKQENLLFGNQSEPITMKFHTIDFEISNTGLITHNRIEFNEIEGDLPVILNNWIKNGNIQDSIILVLEKYTFIKLTVETYFLNTCFAIETFHRKNINNKVLPKSFFDKIKKGIRAKLETQEEMDLFNDRLIYANEPTFKNRLLSLKKEFQIVTIEDFNIDDYINKIVKTRNYLVHRGSNSSIFNASEMHYASVYLETLTKYCLMQNIGFDKELLRKIFKSSGERINQFYEINLSRLNS
jgi:hypothetical protein